MLLYVAFLELSESPGRSSSLVGYVAIEARATYRWTYLSDAQTGNAYRDVNSCS